MNYTTPSPDLYHLPFEFKDFNGMPYRRLGNSGLKVSNVGLGTWKMGYPETGDAARVDEQNSLQILDKSTELGVTFWDTANRYNSSSGNSERIIGTWFKNNPDQRRNVVLATKMAGAMDGRTANHGGLSRLNIMESVYASLERLQTDCIDLLYFHSFDPHTPPEESLMAIEDLVTQDLVRYFAVSNFNTEQLRSYRKIEGDLSSRCRILAVQNQFDILDGESARENGVLQYCTEQGVSFVAWSPMARGLLTDRYLKPAGPGDRLFDEGAIDDKLNPTVIQKLQRLSAIAQEAGLELSQLVIAYMLALPGMGPVIPSSTNIRQLESNAAAGKVVLNESQKQRIQEILV